MTNFYCKCGAGWTGLKIEHCGSCHMTFSSTAAGDRHRTGPMINRRCIDPLLLNEMKIEQGEYEGQPWFVIRENSLGTRIWGRNRPGGRWENENGES